MSVSPDFIAGPCRVLEPIAVGGDETLQETANHLDGIIDLGNEPDSRYALVRNGWLDPEVEDAVDFRRSRGRRSWLNVPILEVRDYSSFSGLERSCSTFR